MATTVVRCLFIGKVWPEPDSTAAGRRSVDLIRALQAADYRVAFASAALATKHSFDLEAIHVDVYSVQPNDPAFDVWVAGLKPDVVLFDRFMTEEQFSWRVEANCPDALRILDTSDLHCLREARRAKVETGAAVDLHNETALREIAAIHRSDLTLMIADYEVALLHETFDVPERQLAYLPFWVDVDANTFAPFEARRDLMMIGNFMHAPNLDGFRWCKREVWPHIREQLPNVEMHCYGAYGDNYQVELHAPDHGFIYKGRADDALITMQQYRVNCVPLRYGAGLKGKVFDGFQTGTPTVTTPVGAEGIVGSEQWGCAIANDPRVFAETVVELYTDAEAWSTVQAQGQRIAQKRFGADRWLPRLPQLIKTALAQMDENRRCHFIGRMLRHHQHRSTEYMSRWIEAKNSLNVEH